MPEYPILVGDIGGTNARFALLTSRDADPTGSIRLADRRFPLSPVEAIEAALAAIAGPRPASTMLAVAAAVTGSVVALTNAGWTFDAPAVRRAFGFTSVTLVNDFVPVAASLGELRGRPDATSRIGPRLEPRDGPILVLGPGTGLGAAVVVPVGVVCAAYSRPKPGHVEFGPARRRRGDGFSRAANGSSSG